MLLCYKEILLQPDTSIVSRIVYLEFSHFDLHYLYSSTKLLQSSNFLTLIMYDKKLNTSLPHSLIFAETNLCVSVLPLPQESPKDNPQTSLHIPLIHSVTPAETILHIDISSFYLQLFLKLLVLNILMHAFSLNPAPYLLLRNLSAQ